MTEELGLIERPRILIADDSEINREMLSEILGDGYEYIFATDGEQLLRLLSEGVAADILLLDMHMPNMSGMDVLKIMQARNWTEDLPVVIISAETDEGFIRNAYHLGAVDYIRRPFDAFMVQNRVENILKMYSRSKRLAQIVEGQVLQQAKVSNALINILSSVVEVSNQESGEHILRVQRLTRMLLDRLVRITDKYTLTEEDILLICSVSALHDIGKVAVPREILNKPGILDAAEWEIMKSHTVKGDEMLWRVSVNQQDKLMVLAHQICRHHHERYDGQGYPDGLVGDDIPIAAQVVALADVYDALTSERCYKRSYPHDRAVAMIMSGDCGSFNPLLLRCLSELDDSLADGMTLNETEEDFLDKLHNLAEETLEQENIPLSNRAALVAESERIKKEFFAQCCSGIQFEYDAVAGKLTSMVYYDGAGNEVLLSNATQLLRLSDWVRLQELVSQATPENPTVTMTALVPLNDVPRWQQITVRCIWTDERDKYVGVVGHFADIHDEKVRDWGVLMINGTKVTGDSFVAMRSVFDVVRMVDPMTCEVLSLQPDGRVESSGIKCYEIWNRKERCKNCTASRAMNYPRWLNKLETRDGSIYSVLSRRVSCQDKTCVLEVALSMEDSEKHIPESIGYLPDSAALQGYYRDSLTNAYSRAYLENFRANLENAEGVAILDVDQFKTINDTFGHWAGDVALKAIVEATRSCIRESDTLIRYGGDEFLLIFRKIGEKAFFSKLQRIKKAVADTNVAEYPDMKLGVSVGGAYCAGRLSRAMDIADKAMYRDKFSMNKG